MSTCVIRIEGGDYPVGAAPSPWGHSLLVALDHFDRNGTAYTISVVTGNATYYGSRVGQLSSQLTILTATNEVVVVSVYAIDKATVWLKEGQ